MMSLFILTLWTSRYKFAHAQSSLVQLDLQKISILRISFLVFARILGQMVMKLLLLPLQMVRHRLVDIREQHLQLGRWTAFSCLHGLQDGHPFLVANLCRGIGRHPLMTLKEGIESLYGIRGGGVTVNFFGAAITGGIVRGGVMTLALFSPILRNFMIQTVRSLKHLLVVRTFQIR